jgi:hypothetical protein
VFFSQHCPPGQHWSSPSQQRPAQGT